MLGFYHLGPDTSALVTRIILADCLVSSLIHSPAFVLPNGIRAAGDARYTMEAVIAVELDLAVLLLVQDTGSDEIPAKRAHE